MYIQDNMFYYTRHWIWRIAFVYISYVNTFLYFNVWKLPLFSLKWTVLSENNFQETFPRSTCKVDARQSSPRAPLVIWLDLSNLWILIFKIFHSKRDVWEAFRNTEPITTANWTEVLYSGRSGMYCQSLVVDCYSMTGNAINDCLTLCNWSGYEKFRFRHKTMEKVEKSSRTFHTVYAGRRAKFDLWECFHTYVCIFSFKLLCELF